MAFSTIKKMKRLLLALQLFSSPVLAEKYMIYTTERRPFSWSGTIDADKTFYYFTNAYEPKCDIVASGCFMKTNEKAEIINKDIIRAQGRYFCSEEHIQEVNKANHILTKLRYSSMDSGYGTCTKDGWVR